MTARVVEDRRLDIAGRELLPTAVDDVLGTAQHDILVTAVAGRSVDRSTGTADLLTQLRADLGEPPHRGRRER
jgi:hypothetical protein